MPDPPKSKHQAATPTIPVEDKHLTQMATLAQRYLYNGVTNECSIRELDAHMRLIFNLHTVSEAAKLLATQFALSRPVLQRWQSFAGSRKPTDPDLTYEDLLQFLSVQYEPLSSTWEAINKLINLRFNDEDPTADLQRHNATFDDLVCRSNFEGSATNTLDLYHCTLPLNLQRETFTAGITSVELAKQATTCFWSTVIQLRRSHQAPPNTVEYMDVDRLTWDSSYPCSKQEFDLRLSQGLCVCCGRGKHAAANCSYHAKLAGQPTVSGQNKCHSRFSNKKKSNIRQITTSPANDSTLQEESNTMDKPPPSQGNAY
ncbi:hypothetical protein FB639_002579 [Coemansia asiatica]|nr:hypothetical protein FB639_002579 [Coemansia asiatica]